MTKKDYVILAETLRRLEYKVPARYLCQVVQEIADQLAKDNPKFDKENFLKEVYCG